MDARRVDGKVVLVSGGSSGVGLAAAKGLARLGARTVLLSRTAERGQAAVRAVLEAAPDASVTAAVVDLVVPSSVTAAVDEVVRREGAIDVLVNATGSVGEVGELAPGIPRSFGTNALTHFLLTRAALPALRQAPDGRVLTVGAAPALIRRLRRPALDGIAPDASAATLITQSLAWKLVLARVVTADGVASTVFHPGLVRSELLSHRSLPLQLVGSVSNRFANEFCPVVDRLASSAAGVAAAGGMVDHHGRPVRLPAWVTTTDGAAVWTAASALAEHLDRSPGRE